MKLTTPKSILIGSVIIAFAIFFRIDENISLVTEANAEVAGMDSYDLRYDYDFKGAVESIVEDCYVDDGSYIYC